MKTILKITDKELGLYESMLEETEFIFIDEMMQVDEPHHWQHYVGFSIRKLSDGEYEIDIDKVFGDWLKDFDHDCTASAEDGCSFCSLLTDLGLKEDYDLSDLDEIQEETTTLEEKLEELEDR